MEQDIASFSCTLRITIGIEPAFHPAGAIEEGAFHE
jgi:hypothetical protein